MTALMTVGETEEDEETESESVAAASQPTPLERRTSSNEAWAKQARSGLAERLVFGPLQVHISHIGQMVLKGVAEPQTVMQFITAHLAARRSPQIPLLPKLNWYHISVSLQPFKCNRSAQLTCCAAT